MIEKSGAVEMRAVERVAEAMCVAARTAPKAKGVDNLTTLILKGEEKDRLAARMRRLGETLSGADFFTRDAGCVDKAAVVVVMGQKAKPFGLPACGFCGHQDCGANARSGGFCAISYGDLGIAIGSAVSVAADHRVDNRVMFSIGRAALDLGFFEADVNAAYGVPLSVSGKSPFHDR